MSGVNKVILIGRLGQDPEVKTISTGSTVARLNIATSENWVDKDGKKQERTEWHRVVAWNKQAETLGKYMTKGRQIYVEGRLQTRKYEDPQGVTKYTTEVVMTGFQFLGGNDNKTSSTTSSTMSSNDPYNEVGPEPTYQGSDDIPF